MYRRPIEKIILTNDLTEKVLHEAVDKKSNLIISYHPPIFSGLKSITQKRVEFREKIKSETNLIIFLKVMEDAFGFGVFGKPNCIVFTTHIMG